MSQQRFVAIGECMIELRHKTERDLSMDFAGDTYNVSVYLARLQQQTGVKISYFTAVGDDPYSQIMLNIWQNEAIDTTLVTTIPAKLPGLYFIRTDAQGERSLYFYRDQSAARDMMKTSATTAHLTTLRAYNYIYFSAITCAILDDTSRAKLFDTLTQARQAGVTICFDSNYRPRIWRNRETAQKTVSEFLQLVDIALPTFEDEQQLFDAPSAQACADRLLQIGVKEVVVKQGSEPCLIATPQQRQWVPAQKVSHVVDTTGAGDSFNAGYLAARFLKQTPEQAAQCGHKLASVVVSHPGAIIPLETMPKLF